MVVVAELAPNASPGEVSIPSRFVTGLGEMLIILSVAETLTTQIDE